MDNIEQLADRYEKSLASLETLVHSSIQHKDKPFIERYATVIIPSIITLITIIGATYVGAYRLGVVERKINILNNKMVVHVEKEHRVDLERQNIKNDVLNIKKNQQKIEIRVDRLYKERE